MRCGGRGGMAGCGGVDSEMRCGGRGGMAGCGGGGG